MCGGMEEEGKNRLQSAKVKTKRQKEKEDHFKQLFLVFLSLTCVSMHSHSLQDSEDTVWH